MAADGPDLSEPSISVCVQLYLTDSGYSQAFQEMDEDQYDFHAYCLRKQTLNAYIECVQQNPFFPRLPLCACRDYFQYSC